jgi:hypothetical protein
MSGAVAAIIALAVIVAGLGVALWTASVRIGGVKDQLKTAALLGVTEASRADQAEKDCKTAREELATVRSRWARLEAQRKGELDSLAIIAARCADAREIREELRRIFSKPVPK